MRHDQEDVNRALDRIRELRSQSANDAIVFQSEAGKRCARSAAWAFNEALKALGIDEGATAGSIEREEALKATTRGW